MPCSAAAPLAAVCGRNVLPALARLSDLAELNAPASADTLSSFELKSATLPLLALLLKTTDLTALAAEFTSRFAGDLFDDDALVLDLSPLPPDAAPPDFEVLVALLRSHHLQPVAVRGGSESLRAAAHCAGLVEVEAAGAPRTAAAPMPAAPSPAPVQDARPVATLIVDRPLRSGQQVYARGGDLVVLAAVSDGAEVMADGSIHVYAPLRGRAVAGARGHGGARIFSTCMAPQLVSIAGTWRTTDTPLPADILGRPAQVRLAGERLVFEPLGR